MCLECPKLDFSQSHLWTIEVDQLTVSTHAVFKSWSLFDAFFKLNLMFVDSEKNIHQGPETEEMSQTQQV